MTRDRYVPEGYSMREAAINVERCASTPRRPTYEELEERVRELTDEVRELEMENRGLRQENARYA